MNLSRWSVATVGPLLAAALVLPLRVNAGSPNLPPAEIVRFADLNLNTPAGIGSLYRRIHLAALDVCEPLQAASTVLPSSAWRSCMSKAVSAAVHDVNLPSLTAYHDRQENHVIPKG